MFNVSVRKVVVSAIAIAAPVALSFGASTEAWGGKTFSWDKPGAHTHAGKTFSWDKHQTVAGKTFSWDVRGGSSTRTLAWD
jgi:hypothetical protein